MPGGSWGGGRWGGLGVEGRSSHLSAVMLLGRGPRRGGRGRALARRGARAPPVAGASPARRNFAAPVGLKMAGLAFASGCAKETLPKEKRANLQCVKNERERKNKNERASWLVSGILTALCPPVPVKPSRGQCCLRRAA